jgi:hypothetical protein
MSLVPDASDQIWKSISGVAWNEEGGQDILAFQKFEHSRSTHDGELTTRNCAWIVASRGADPGGHAVNIESEANAEVNHAYTPLDLKYSGKADVQPAGSLVFGQRCLSRSLIRAGSQC